MSPIISDNHDGVRHADKILLHVYYPYNYYHNYRHLKFTDCWIY